MIEITSLNEELKDHAKRIDDLRGIFDVENKTLELKKLTDKLSDPTIWDDPKTAQEVNKQKVYLERELNKFSVLAESISDSVELAEIAIEENDNLALEEIAKGNI